MTISSLDHHPFPSCLEIINPSGSITFHKSKESYAFRKGRIVNTSLSIALLLGTYDADSIISHMLSDIDRQQCNAWQEEWHKKVIDALYMKSENIINCSGWPEKLPAEDQLQLDISKIGISGSRLMRFILEQASVNISKIVLEVSRANGFDRTIWPDTSKIDPKISEQLKKRIYQFWPVVGIRMDYLVTRKGSRLKVNIWDKYKKHKKQTPHHQKYKEECLANRPSHRVGKDESEGDQEENADDGKWDFDPFADEGK